MSDPRWTHQEEIEFRLMQKRRTKVLEARQSRLTAALGNCPGISAQDIPKLAESLVLNAAQIADALAPYAENLISEAHPVIKGTT